MKSRAKLLGILVLLPLASVSLTAADSEEANGSLLLDSRAGWMAGGDSGRAVVPGSPEDSLLVRAIGYTDSDLQMPPRGKLSDADIAGAEQRG